MRIKRKSLAIGAMAAAAATVGIAAAGDASPAGLTAVPNAQPKAAGLASPNVLSPELAAIAVAQGSTPLENPTAAISHYGYYADGPVVPAPGTLTEATKSEPDKNTYLVVDGLTGADAGYEYGSHFLFQGHEAGSAGYVTRINLDADAAHRVTLIGAVGVPASIDGSTWNPFAHRLLITGESSGANGGVWQLHPNPGGPVERIAAAGTSAGYEGVQTDDDGNLWLVGDVGGRTGAVNTKARQPNSFVYRLIPTDRHDLTKGGKLQVLQVRRNGNPIVFHAGQADADITSPDVAALHTYGQSFPTAWVTIHDTATDGSALFDANAAAKAKGGTPFKRPENGVFRPDGTFREFYFTETGDTNVATQAGSALGGFGALFRLTQPGGPSANAGELELFYLGDVAHTGLDNIQFLTRNTVLATEDAGDGVHTGRKALDSGYAFDVRAAIPTPFRFLAEGRDASATIDSALSDAGTPGYQNDGDNEITGIHVSNGDPTVRGLLGARRPKPWRDGWRVFYTAQHGDNVTYEIVKGADVRDDGNRRAR